MADAYVKQAQAVIDTLTGMTDEAAMCAAIRQLVEKVVVRPTPGRERLKVDLYGRLAGMFTLETTSDRGKPRVQVTPVAGVGFGCYLPATVVAI